MIPLTSGGARRPGLPKCYSKQIPRARSRIRKPSDAAFSQVAESPAVPSAEGETDSPSAQPKVLGREYPANVAPFFQAHVCTLAGDLRDERAGRMAHLGVRMRSSLAPFSTSTPKTVDTWAAAGSSPERMDLVDLE
jgi:hypothetical protein